MTFTDWLLDIALIGMVLLQMRGLRLTVRGLLIPVVIVGWAATKYLHGIPTTGNDLVLVIGGAAVGTLVGVGVGVLTRVYRDKSGVVFARATIGAAALWVLGMGFRLAFQIYATNGGGPSIARFSVDNQLSIAAWTTAILLMALCQVLTRTFMVWWRGRPVPLSSHRVTTAR
jgi:hypothetical protein